MVEQDETQSKNKGRWFLVLMVTFFTLPLIAVMLMHHFDWHPGGASHGEIISPVVKLSIPSGLLDSNSKSLPESIWQDKWSMVYVAEHCLEQCKTSLHDMRQIHVSLAKDSDRVQRILISQDSETSSFKQDYPEMLLINQPAEEVQTFSKAFLMANGVKSKPEGVFLVDPLGNLMMTFPVTVKAADIRSDLVKLLKYSWAG